MVKDYNKSDYKKDSDLATKFDEIVVKITENETSILAELLENTDE